MKLARIGDATASHGFGGRRQPLQLDSRFTIFLLAALLSGVAVAEERHEPPSWTTFDPTALEDDRNWLFTTDRSYWRQNFFKRLWDDQVFLFTTWIPAEGRRPLFYGPLVVSLAGASQSAVGGLDMQWSHSIEVWASDGKRDVFERVTFLGDANIGAALVGTTYLLSRWTGNDRMAKTASLSGEALLNAVIYNTILKRVARRTRPVAGGNGEFFVADLLPGQDNRSFPSGHAMGAFSIAAVLAGEFRERRWVAWAAYGTAGAIAFSRVALGKHFLSDVLAGAVLGDSFGRMVVHRSDGETRIPIHRRFSPIVDPESGGVGVGFRYSW